MADSDDLNPIYVDNPDAPKSEEAPAGRTQEKLDKFKEIAGENLERLKVVTIKSLIVAKDVSLKLITKAKENWEPLKELVKRFTHFDSDVFRTTQRFCIRNPAIFVVFGIFMFFCIYRFLVFVDPVEEDILDEVTLVEEFHPFNFNKYTVPSNLTQKKVVLFSYTRAGASILGHIFNLAPSVAYWYEPMHSFYTHLFGNRVFAISNEITHRENGMRREMSEEEQTKAASFIKDLLSCKFENIPVETFSIESIVERKIEWMQSYRECMLGRVDNPTVRHCMDPLSSFCGSMTTHCIKERCDYFNELARQAQTSDQRDRAIEEVEAKSKKKLKAFMDKEDCMADLVQAQSYCLPDLHAACLDARINVMKVYRTSPVVLEEVLSTDPDVFVIHYFRDPRAMIWSRQQSDTLSTISGKKDKSESAARHMEREARMLCRQLVEDILAISKIKMKYADRIAVFRYEDFVANANETIAYVYGRIGEEYPSTLPNRINRLMTSNREPDGPFGYIRQDAAQTAHAWREAIDPEVKVFIDNECKGVLTALKYEV